MPSKASIAIFQKSHTYEEKVSKPVVPDAVFKAAKRVMKSKKHELVEVDGGFYIVKYSPNGPFQRPMGDSWLPVYVARIDSWSSGGVKKEEFDLWSEQQNAE